MLVPNELLVKTAAKTALSNSHSPSDRFNLRRSSRIETQSQETIDPSVDQGTRRLEPRARCFLTVSVRALSLLKSVTDANWPMLPQYLGCLLAKADLSPRIEGSLGTYAKGVVPQERHRF